MDDPNIITIYTDGSCLNNPGRGGYGCVLMFRGKRKELSGGFRLTTNNRMEILAAIKALETLKPNQKYKVILHSDSGLLCNAFNKRWIFSWQKKNWKKSNKEMVLNPDLWVRLLEVYAKHDVEFKWVKAHVGIPENERCDQLAKDAAEGDNLPADIEYEKQYK